MPQHGPTRPSSFVLIAAVACFAVSTGAVRAAQECIAKPTSEAPQGQRWYYRTHHESKCWHLGPAGGATRTIAAERLKPSEPHAPAATAALDAAELTPQQREALFRKYIEWQRTHPAQAAQ